MVMTAPRTAPKVPASPGSARRGPDPRSAGRTLDRIAPLAPNAWLRYDVVDRMLPPAVTDVLEVGCGRGAFAARLAVGYHYLGVEPDSESCAIAAGRVAAVGHGEVRDVAAETLTGQQFDLVCAFEVLEHLEDDVKAVAQWAALLRPGGWLLLSVPAHQHRFGPWDEMAGHFRRYDPAVMTALLTDAGFSDITIRLYGFPLGYLAEPLRNVVARRKLAATAGQSVAERTASSGRQLQPAGGGLGAAIRLGTVPFRLIQRAFPQVGTGMVVRARLAPHDR
jgi:SAM-dependent methyltransferase